MALGVKDDYTYVFFDLFGVGDEGGLFFCTPSNFLNFMTFLTVLMKIYMYYYMQKGGFLMAVVRPLS
jgi:hypothetical protein